jgi:hypothetical protein
MTIWCFLTKTSLSSDEMEHECLYRELSDERGTQIYKDFKELILWWVIAGYCIYFLEQAGYCALGNNLYICIYCSLTYGTI